MTAGALASVRGRLHCCRAQTRQQGVLRKELQLPYGGGSLRGDANLTGKRLEPQHLRPDGPNTVRQFEEAEKAFLVRGCCNLRTALRGCYGHAGERQASGMNCSAKFGCHHPGNREPGGKQPTQKDCSVLVIHTQKVLANPCDVSAEFKP